LKHAIHRPLPLPLPTAAAASEEEERSASRSLETARGHREDWAPVAGVAALPIEAEPAAIIRREEDVGRSCTGRVDPDAACGVDRPVSSGGYFAGKVGARGNVEVRRDLKLRGEGEQGKMMTMIVLCQWR
jgi:hypothetical protein